MSTPSSSPDRERIGVRYVSDAVKRDHRSLEKLYATLSDTGSTDDAEHKRELQQRFCWELARHLVAMNLFIFPGTSRRASQGNRSAMDRQKDFALLRGRLLDLSAARDGDEDEEEGFRGLLAQLREGLARHIREVERADLVAIEKVLSGEESERLASDFEASVFFIPPEVRAGPEGKGGVRAPFETIGALLDASAEELSGVLDGFPRD
ncbi:hypothetical protein VPNG_02474 [Cytospora leucostoma]|uniref:Hemerythrin-like domain-containing protein n=1 Tax=Cytospora leucostoma TaxID=1230097 RepID=A0A423XHL8_9PEZI|nr:hypothetical protein VPNG_02474 [Cytospora leucostoma]